MLRKFIFKYNNAGYDNELILPITPESFRVSHGISIETVHVHTMGEVNVAGSQTLATITVECVFPAKKYSFLTGPYNPDPYVFVNAFQKWADTKLLVRFVVPGTSVNMPVLVESIEYGEQDGTNDVYARLTLQEYRELNIAAKPAVAAAQPRSTPASSPATAHGALSYTVKSGDTLSAICLKYYKDASLYPKLAAHNGVKNPHLIFSGQVLKIPDKGQL